MTSKTTGAADMSNYSTRELIELSVLDAAGVLDEGERSTFERSFAAASPAIQAHVRREQTRLAQVHLLLPDVEPAADLRSAVLEAVRRAMAGDLAAEESAGRSAFVPALLPSRRVSPLWRAGAVGFATAAVVFGFTTLQMQNQFEDLKVQLSANQFTDQTLTSLGGEFKDSIFNANIRHVMFTPASSAVKGMAVLLLNSEAGTASLVCQGLPAAEGRKYRLVVLNADGALGEQLASFSSRGLTAEPVKISLVRGQRLAILAPSDPGSPDAGPILTTEPLAI